MNRYVSLFFSALWLTCASAFAQQGDLLEYQQELGGGVGISSYLGDASSGLLKEPGFSGSLIWRRNLNPRMVLKTHAAYGHISGNTQGLYIPENPSSGTATGGDAAPEIHFNRHLVDAGLDFELNFLGYGLGAAYKNLSRWTPYLLAGLGFVVGFGGGGETAGGLNIPVGLGFRFKLMPRLNLGLECTVNFTTCDRLDDADYSTHLDDPYGIKSSPMKNKDCYTKAFITLTYDIAPKYRRCNN